LWPAEYVSPQAKSSCGKKKTGVHKSRVLRCRLIHIALVLRLFAPTLLANFNHCLICAHFMFIALWRFAFYYPKSIFLMGISFFIFYFFYLRPLFQESNQGDKQGLGVRADFQHGTCFMSPKVQVVSFPQDSLPKLSMHFSSPPYVLHTPRIPFLLI